MGLRCDGFGGDGVDREWGVRWSLEGFRAGRGLYLVYGFCVLLRLFYVFSNFAFRRGIRGFRVVLRVYVSLGYYGFGR